MDEKFKSLRHFGFGYSLESNTQIGLNIEKFQRTLDEFFAKKPNLKRVSWCSPDGGLLTTKIPKQTEHSDIVFATDQVRFERVKQ